MPELDVAALAADASTFPVWDPNVPFPDAEHMEDLDVVTHVMIERGESGGFHYLHESSLDFHQGELYACWANHPTHEINVTDERIRGRVSDDGGRTWRPPTEWVASTASGSASFNHPVIADRFGVLWGFFTRWDGEMPSTEIFQLDDATGTWKTTGTILPLFVPFRPPSKMRDGNWLISGELHWYEAAAAISRGDDFSAWDIVRIPREPGVKFLFPETAIVDSGDRLLAVCRPLEAPTAPAAESWDCGRTWTALRPSNFPLESSQPFAGTLSTGQHFLITANAEHGRHLMSIAVTKRGETLFSRMWKIRHQQFPRRRLFGGCGDGSWVGWTTEWSYPAAVERDGNLYVSYTRGKEDCVLSIIPIRALEV